MSAGIAFIHWENYRSSQSGNNLFDKEPLTFNSRQERLHRLMAGDRLWLVSRCPEDSQYYFVAVLYVAQLRYNSASSDVARAYGEFAVEADRAKSVDLGKSFPCEGLLRAIHFEPGKPIRFGASIGQSLQTIRLLSPCDIHILDAALGRLVRGERPLLDTPFGLWTKCDPVFADFFWKNWSANRLPLAFLLYDSPPLLAPQSPVFIHSDKKLRLIACFRGSQFVAGYKPTADPLERLQERERIWTQFRAETLDPPAKADFDVFWDAQHGVRSLVLIDNFAQVVTDLAFKQYGRALEWSYPMGVGYRYLTFSQCLLLLRASGLSKLDQDIYLKSLLLIDEGHSSC
jgi:hypothetical protein